MIRFRMAEPGDALCVGALATQVFLDTYAGDGLRPDLAREALTQYSTAAFEARIRDSSNHFLLAERAEAHAKASGAPLLWLTAWVGNANALAFYLARGYKDVGATTYEFEGRAHENRVFSKMFG